MVKTKKLVRMLWPDFGRIALLAYYLLHNDD